MLRALGFPVSAVIAAANSASCSGTSWESLLPVVGAVLNRRVNLFSRAKASRCNARARGGLFFFNSLDRRSVRECATNFLFNQRCGPLSIRSRTESWSGNSGFMSTDSVPKLRVQTLPIVITGASGLDEGRHGRRRLVPVSFKRSPKTDQLSIRYRQK